MGPKALSNDLGLRTAARHRAPRLHPPSFIGLLAPRPNAPRTHERNPMPATSFRSVLLLSACVAAAASGCPAAPGGGTPCDVDTDCATGEYCMGGGVGCTFDCRTDVDCLASGGGTCTGRGRCEGTTADAGPRDGAPPPRDSAGPCGADGDCDDGVFCNGAERCAPAEAGAAPNGCVAPSGARCLPSQTCNEGADRCDSACDSNPDADGDGDPSIDCPGGGDCDDADPDRSSVRVERCDTRNIDEDCDPCTVGSPDSDPPTSDADSDDDDFFSDACANRFDGDPPTCPAAELGHVVVDGVLVRGTDCNDNAAGVFPTATEACTDAIDNDCDGLINEDGRVDWWPDLDSDGRGDASATPISDCATPPRHVTNNFDCNDANPDIYGPTPTAPGAVDTCNNVNDDCDASVDEGDPGGGAACNPPGRPGSPCAGMLHCVGGAVTCVQNDASYPRSGGEMCNSIDDDCDGTIDTIPVGCGDACGAGTATCIMGAPVGCVVPARDEPCNDACGGGRTYCSGGGPWTTCSSPTSRDCGIVCSGWNGTSTVSATTPGRESCSHTSGYSGVCSPTGFATTGCSRCGGRETGSMTCQSNATFSSCSAPSYGEYYREACSPGGAWPYGHVSCASDNVNCTPDSGTLDQLGAWTSGDCGGVSGGEWAVPWNYDANCNVGRFVGALPPGNYRFTWWLNSGGDCCAYGVWVDVAGGHVTNPQSNIRVGPGTDVTVTANVSIGGTLAISPSAYLVYRGGPWTQQMSITWMTITRL